MITKEEIYKKITTQSKHLSWLPSNVIYLCLAGSHSYGTNVEGSDFDFKGVFIPPKQYFLSGSNFIEQVELKDPDFTVYEIRKYFNLLMACNPSLIENLFVDPSDYIQVTELGQILIDNRDKFLSKRARYSFSGYAFAQLKKIQLRKQYILNPPKEKPTREAFGLPEQTLIPQDQLTAAQAEIDKELDTFSFNFLEGLSEDQKIAIRNIMSEMLARLKISSEDQWMAAARRIGLSDNFIYIMQQERAYTNKKREWDKYKSWEKNRNPKRHEMEKKFFFDGKNALHLIRLCRMAKEIITTGKVIVKRPDAEELKSILEGAWTYDQVVEFAENSEKELDVLYKTSNALPHSPDKEFLDNLCMELTERALAGGQKANLDC